MLNDISAAVTQQDLESRTITVEMPATQNAQTKDALEAEFEANRASILGGLLGIVAKTLEYLSEFSLPAHERPRLVEFAYLGMAVAKAMVKRPEDFKEQFRSGPPSRTLGLPIRVFAGTPASRGMPISRRGQRCRPQDTGGVSPSLAQKISAPECKGDTGNLAEPS